jgi:DNA repair protein RecN (Recombination protein N)
MLQRLHIQNYAIIDEVEIDFSRKLNVITGETGAGKSILMGALSLILGERAETSALRNNAKKCFIEGHFAVPAKEEIRAFFSENDLELDDSIVLRREINNNGKSRGFINDTPATLQQLKQLASMLVDLHQQFDTLELGDADFQRTVLDALAGNETHFKEYKKLYADWVKKLNELKELQDQKNAFTKEADYNQFLFDELNEASLKENELEDIESELKLLNSSEAVKAALNKVYFDLKESESPITTILKQLNNQLSPFSTHHTSIASILERLNAANIELNDIASEVEYVNHSVNYDEKRIEAINEKINIGYKLLKKHGVRTTNELLQIQKELEEKLQAVLHIDDAIAAAEKETTGLQKSATDKASVLRKNRQKQIAPFEKNVNELLRQVGMPNAALKVELKEKNLQADGADAISFLFDANKSGRFEPIEKVASGGELSRLMLCIKSLVAESVELPTMIFDEIDTGISGEAAKQVGLIMKGMSAKRQIICITHQPQIAGKADAHLFVYKELKDEAVKTNIRLLNNDERIINIAKMLSGEKPTAAALENAREMMN